MKRSVFPMASMILLSFLSVASFAYEREIEILATNMAEKIATSGKTKVAVVDFTDLHGDVTELGRFIAEELSVSLASSGKGFKIVDRTHLKSIIKEHKLSTTGLIAPETARKLGQIAGVEALITGSLTPFGDTVRLTVKLLDTESAEVISANKVNIAKTAVINELLEVKVEPEQRFSHRSSSRIKDTDVKVSKRAKAQQKDGLLAYYPFDGNAGIKEGIGYEGHVFGAQLTQDRYGNENSAYRFNGVNNYISLGHLKWYTTGSWTWAAWVKKDGQGNHMIMSHRTGWGGNGAYFSVYSGKMFVTVTKSQALDKDAFPFNSWQFVVAIQDKEQLKLYRNDKLVSSVIATNVLAPSEELALEVGRHYRHQQYWKGAIDEVRIYNRALSDDEVKSLYEDSLPYTFYKGL